MVTITKIFKLSFALQLLLNNSALATNHLACSKRDNISYFSQSESYEWTQKFSTSQVGHVAETHPFHHHSVPLDAPWERYFTSFTVVDSWGEFPLQTLSGIPDQPGDYEQCLSVQQKDVSGKYCTIYLHGSTASNFSTYDELRNHFGLLSGVELIANDVQKGSYGTCIPDSCSKEDLSKSIWNKTSRYIIQIQKVVCVTKNTDLMAGDYFFLAFMAVLLALLVGSTVLKSTAQIAEKKSFKKYVLAFSPVRNLSAIFRLHKSKSPDEVHCIRGIRVISMICVIICHQYGMTSHTRNVSLIYGTGEGVSATLALIAGCASLSVDTFLCVSGFLLSYSKFNNSQQSQRLHIKKMYSNRVIRLTPSVLVSCFFFATLGRRLVSGPWAQEFELISEACRKHWWKEVLHVANFFYNAAEKDSFPMFGNLQCNAQSWSTSVDTQIYFLSPLILLPLLSNKISGYVWLIFITLCSIITQMSILYTNGLPPTNILSLSLETNLNYYTKYYVMPWCRCGSWLIGLWAGLALARCPNIKQIIGRYKVYGWIISIALIEWTVEQTMILNMKPTLYVDSDPLYSALFGACHRMAWAVAMSWIILACHCQSGGLFGEFLSHEGWRPLSKLTYSTFIVALNVQFMIAFSKKQVDYMSHFNMFLESCGAVILSLMFGLILSVCVEVPVINLLNAATT